MTTPPEADPGPDDPREPVVHMTRRAALQAERDAARRPARRGVVRAVRTTPRAERTATPPSPERTPPGSRLRLRRAGVASAVAAFALFAASAMPAHAGPGTSTATASFAAPSMRTQDYAVTTAVAQTAADRDGFTVSAKRANTAGGAVTTGEGDVRSPFPGPVRMSSGFGYRDAPCGACSSQHEGLDFNPGMGAPIGAVAAGRVRVSGTYFSYGTAVIIDHVIDGRKVSTLYGHMIPGSSPLRAGDEVEVGEFIGKVGSSGVSTGAHLHLEVLADGTRPIDPRAWLEARIGHTL